ncbi:hypothetical protein ABMA27_004419 [Loxostege sticticalis]|uniref:Uncharacterized protein n=1 Tax=Loxostege sticticalis TaxID=481309 RepID=A0ABR3HNM0_LOXSC
MIAKLVFLFAILAFALAKPQYISSGYGYGGYGGYGYPGYYGYSGYSPYSYGSYGSYGGSPYNYGYGPY